MITFSGWDFSGRADEDWAEESGTTGKITESSKQIRKARSLKMVNRFFSTLFLRALV
jgi:hypothetical protein